MKTVLWSVLVLVALGATAGPMVAASVTERQSTPPVQATADKPLNLNTADARALQTLPGVGPALAQRILEYREKNGSFKKIEELMNVQGIGEKTFLKLKPLVMVPPPKTVRF